MNAIVLSLQHNLTKLHHASDVEVRLENQLLLPYVTCFTLRLFVDSTLQLGQPSKIAKRALSIATCQNKEQKFKKLC